MHTNTLLWPDMQLHHVCSFVLTADLFIFLPCFQLAISPGVKKCEPCPLLTISPPMIRVLPPVRTAVHRAARQELEGTLRDPEVAELEVVGRERTYVEACGAAVRRMSADSLARGMKALNQTDIGGALQVRALGFLGLDCTHNLWAFFVFEGGLFLSCRLIRRRLIGTTSFVGYTLPRRRPSHLCMAQQSCSPFFCFKSSVARYVLPLSPVYRESNAREILCSPGAVRYPPLRMTDGAPSPCE